MLTYYWIIIIKLIKTSLGLYNVLFLRANLMVLTSTPETYAGRILGSTVNFPTLHLNFPLSWSHLEYCQHLNCSTPENPLSKTVLPPLQLAMTHNYSSSSQLTCCSLSLPAWISWLSTSITLAKIPQSLDSYSFLTLLAKSQSCMNWITCLLCVCMRTSKLLEENHQL